MLKFLGNFFLVIVLFFILDFLCGIFFEKIINSSCDGRYYKIRYSLENCNEKIIIFGSSRAETNYAPFVFEDSLKLTCWNTGRGGQVLPFWYAIQKGILKRYSPQIVIVNIESDFLSEKGLSYEKAGILRPFYKKHHEIRKVINKISPNEKFLMTSSLYAYNSSFYYLFRPFLIKGLDGKNEDKGWKPRIGITEKLKIKMSKSEYLSGKLNPQSVLLFEDFIHSFVQKGCKIFVCVSPDYSFTKKLLYLLNLLRK